MDSKLVGNFGIARIGTKYQLLFGWFKSEGFWSRQKEIKVKDFGGGAVCVLLLKFVVWFCAKHQQLYVVQWTDSERLNNGYSVLLPSNMSKPFVSAWVSGRHIK